MVDVKLGYYIQDDGEDVFYYFMGAEPPLEQYALRNGVWEPLPVYGIYNGRLVTLVDGYYLMDKIMDGDPEVDGPFDELPEGVPPFEGVPAGDQPPKYIFDGDWKPLVPPFESPSRS